MKLRGKSAGKWDLTVYPNDLSKNYSEKVGLNLAAEEMGLEKEVLDILEKKKAPGGI